MWETWAERLTDPELPSEAAFYFAQHGSVVQRWQLTSNENLPEAVMIMLVEDGDVNVSGGMATNYGISGDLLERLIALRPELEPLASANQNAFAERKSKGLLEHVTGGSLERFFHDVGATAEEERAFHAIIGEIPPKITVGQAWAKVRPRPAD